MFEFTFYIYNVMSIPTELGSWRVQYLNVSKLHKNIHKCILP